MDITNKVALVVGGIGGIGFATVKALLKSGAKFVAILDIKSATKEYSVEDLEKEYSKDRVAFYKCDVTEADKFAAIYDEILKRQKSIDILVNSAVILDELKVNAMIDIDFTSVITSTFLAIEKMGKHNGGNGGVILNISSIAGLIYPQVTPLYCAIKHGITALTRALQDQYKNTSVRVLSICPGITRTQLIPDKFIVPNFVDDEILAQIAPFMVDPQSPEHVAASIVKMVREAEPGALWVCENDLPAYAVTDPLHYKERRVDKTLC